MINCWLLIQPILLSGMSAISRLRYQLNSRPLTEKYLELENQATGQLHAAFRWQRADNQYSAFF